MTKNLENNLKQKKGMLTNISGTITAIQKSNDFIPKKFNLDDSYINYIQTTQAGFIGNLDLNDSARMLKKFEETLGNNYKFKIKENSQSYSISWEKKGEK